MKKLLVLAIIVFIANLTYAQWEADVRLTNDPAESWTNGASQRNIASDADFVHVVWGEERDGNLEIYYKRSVDGGVSWGADTRLTNQSGESSYPSISVNGLVVHVVWNDDRDGNFEIYYKRSTDGGISWGADIRLTNAIGESYMPSATVFGSVVHVVWEDIRDGNSEIYYKRSTDGGLNWGADIRLTNDNADSYFPSVAVSVSTVSVVWSDYRDIDEEIYYKRSADGGSTWGADTRLTNSAGWSDYPSISASGDFIHVVWYDFRDGGTTVSQIYYKRSADGGLSWDADTSLTSGTYASWYASVVASDSIVHVVWEGYSDIHYKRSTDGGISWGQYSKLTNHSSPIYPPISSIPSLAIFGTTVHVVWSDNRNLNYEIYYRRNPNGGINGIEGLDYALNDATIYPNPASDNISISFSKAELSNMSISIFNSIGIELKRFDEMDLCGSNSFNIITESFPPGVYYCTLDKGTHRISRSFVILR